MYQTVSESDFAQVMREFADWPYAASVVLFDYLEEVGGEVGYGQGDTGIELDPIAFRCAYTVHADFDSYKSDYGHDNVANVEELAEHTLVLEVGDGSIIVQEW